MSRVTVLVISGSMGSGKTTVLGEAADMLTAADVPHAAINLDALSMGHVRGGWPADIWARNLAAVWATYAAIGIDRLLLSEAIDERRKLDLVREAIPGAAITVCRLRASVPTLQSRVRVREPGPMQSYFVARAAQLDAALDAAAIEDFSVDNDGRPIAEVTREVLERAGWLEA